MKWIMPSLPASCLLAQAAIACSNVKMKRVPALSDPALTTLYLAGGWARFPTPTPMAGIEGHTLRCPPQLVFGPHGCHPATPGDDSPPL